MLRWRPSGVLPPSASASGERTAMTRKCTASGDGWSCYKSHNAHGYCLAHCLQLRRGRPLTPIKRGRKRSKVERHDPNDMLCAIPEGHQRCTGCKVIKPFSDFRVRDAVAVARCKKCQADEAMDFKYGVGASEWWRWKMLEQGWKCAGCKTKDPGKRGWQFDHCHESERWRNVLCGNCNIASGYIEKNGWNIQAFAAYAAKENLTQSPRSQK